MADLPKELVNLCSDPSPSELTFRTVLALIERFDLPISDRFREVLSEWPYDVRSLDPLIHRWELNQSDVYPTVHGLELISSADWYSYDGSGVQHLRWLITQPLNSLRHFRFSNSFSNSDPPIPREFFSAPWYSQLASVSMNLGQLSEFIQGGSVRPKSFELDVWSGEVLAEESANGSIQTALEFARVHTVIEVNPSTVESFLPHLSAFEGCAVSLKVCGLNSLTHLLRRIPVGLRRLEIESTTVVDEDLRLIFDRSVFPMLTDFRVVDCDFQLSNWRPLDESIPLQSLVWMQDQAIEEVFAPSSLPQLRKFELWNRMGSKALKWLLDTAVRDSVEHLSISCQDGISIIPLFEQQWQKLRSIEIWGHEISRGLLRMLGTASAGKLSDIRIGNTRINSDAFTELSNADNFSFLRKMSLGHSAVPFSEAVEFCRSEVASNLQSLLAMQVEPRSRTNDFLEEIAAENSFQHLVEWSWPFCDWDEKVTVAVLQSNLVRNLDILKVLNNRTEIAQLATKSSNLRQIAKANLQWD